jgi:hypothetical protein
MDWPINDDLPTRKEPRDRILKRSTACGIRISPLQHAVLPTELGGMADSANSATKSAF